jgi:ribose transport system substrate-binding protein
MNRKFGMLATALLSVSLLAGCTMAGATTAATVSPTTGSAAPGKAIKGDVKIGLVGVNLNSPSITRIKDAFVAAAKTKGWTVEVFDGQGDQAATNNAADDFISRVFSAIVNDASPNQQMSGVIARAHAAKIPFVSIYGGNVPGLDAEIGTNEFVNSSLITQEMVNKLGGKGRVVKLNWTVLQALRDRDAGFHAIMGENKGIKVVREIELKVPGQVDDTYQQLTNILQSDKTINAVWIGWDELAPPAVRAIEEAGLKDKVFVVGFDGNPFAWDLIRKGSPYVMEPASPFEPMGEKAAGTIETLLKGGTLASNVIYMKPCLMNRDTVPAAGKFPDWKTCAFFPGEIG